MRTLVVVAALVACKNDRPPDNAVVEPEIKPAQPAPKPSQPKPNTTGIYAACFTSANTICDGEEVAACTPEGKRGATVQRCNGGCRDGKCLETCAARDVELIYLSTDQGQLLAFDPKKPIAEAFRVIGTMECEPGGSPFSMAVDHDGIAWVLHDSGKVFRVSLLDARCIAGAAPTGNAPKQFGMGFAMDAKGAKTESLYVGANDDSKMLAKLDTSTWPPAWVEIGAIAPAADRNPEFTGTADGELFAYTPGPGLGFVQQVDRTSAKRIGQKWMVGNGENVRVGYWAFAHWGGVFYVFATTDDQGSSVSAVHRKSGASQRLIEHLPYKINGAGVSTCAPMLEKT